LRTIDLDLPVEPLPGLLDRLGPHDGLVTAGADRALELVLALL
jgi:hypothetical protein